MVGSFASPPRRAPERPCASTYPAWVKTRMNRILLVDDERNVHYSLQRALGEAFRIVSAFTGEEALQRLSSDKPQLILLDVKLPGADGLETLRRIKAVDREVPVI